MSQYLRFLNLFIYFGFCSVHSIPRVSHYSGKADLSTENELRTLTRRIVRTEYITVLAQHTDAQDE